MKFYLSLLGLGIPVFLLLVDIIRPAVLTEAEIRRSAQEDIFGFGFWPTWIVLAIIEFSISLFSITISKTWMQKSIVAFLAIAFVSVSVVSYIQYSELRTRAIEIWEKKLHP